MSHSIVQLGRKYFNCNDGRMALWSAFAIEEILTTENPSEWLSKFGDSLARFVEAGAMFTDFDQVNFNEPQILAEFSELNQKVRKRLESVGDKIPQQQANAFKIGSGAIHFPEDVSTEVVMKVVRTIELILTNVKPKGEVFDVLPV